MSKKKRLVPFSMTPASWTLTGKNKQRAELEYYYEGAELEDKLFELEYEGVDADTKSKAALTRKFKSGKIDQNEYDKQMATLNGEPFVRVLDMGMNPEMVTQGYFELDWNDEFVKMLTTAGLAGTSDEDIVNKWFNAVCRTVLNQELADRDYGMEDERPDVEYIRKK